MERLEPGLPVPPPAHPLGDPRRDPRSLPRPGRCPHLPARTRPLILLGVPRAPPLYDTLSLGSDTAPRPCSALWQRLETELHVDPGTGRPNRAEIGFLNSQSPGTGTGAKRKASRRAHDRREAAPTRSAIDEDEHPLDPCHGQRRWVARPTGQRSTGQAPVSSGSDRRRPASTRPVSGHRSAVTGQRGQEAHLTRSAETSDPTQAAANGGKRPSPLAAIGGDEPYLIQAAADTGKHPPARQRSAETSTYPSQSATLPGQRSVETASRPDPDNGQRRQAPISFRQRPTKPSLHSI